MSETSKPTTGRKPEKALSKGNTAAPAAEVLSGSPKRRLIKKLSTQVPNIEPLKELHQVLDINVVATLAAKLLNGDDFDGAAKRAMSLLIASAKIVTVFRQVRGMVMGEAISNKSCTFIEGAKIITGQVRADRAVQYLQDFLAAIVDKMPELKTKAERTKKLSDWISHYEKKGFAAGNSDSDHGPWTENEARKMKKSYQRFKKPL